MYTAEREARLPAKKNLRRGAWTREEDERLSQCVKSHGESRWRFVPVKAGLNRCPRSCRMRWLNYLRPTIKRGNITQDEEDLIIRLHKLLGNRWSLIAGRLPGRTDNEIKNYWKTQLSKKIKLPQPREKELAAAPCESELAEGRNGLTQINHAGGRDELRTEPTATVEAGVSMDKFNKEQILRVDDAMLKKDQRISSNTSNPEPLQMAMPCTYGLDYSSLNDWDFCVGMNLDSDVDLQSFIHSLCCEEA